jgi:phosphohistidine phosphatase
VEPVDDVGGREAADWNVLALKRVTVLRHAQAAQLQGGIQDFERPLTPRGRTQALEAASLLIALHLVPDLIVASAAHRTRETAELLHTAGLLAPLHPDERLYLASPAAMFALVHATDSKVDHLLLVGHNPGVSEFCRLLDGNPQLAELPTAAFHSVTFEGDWTAACAGVGGSRG